MPPITGDARAIPRAVWLTARARNAVHRPVFIGAVGIGTFIATIVALVLAPQQAKHMGQLPSMSAAARPDTVQFLSALGHAQTRLATADSSLGYARAHVASVRTPTADTLSPLLIHQRDSLAAAVNDLDGFLTRAESAPLTASYRALGESPQLSSNGRIKSLLDSLNQVERDRESFGTTGGADPVYVALTARAGQIGRAIQSVAQQRRDELRDQIVKLNTPDQRQLVAQTPSADTAGWVVERDSAQSLVVQANSALRDARKQAKDFDASAERAREQARFSTPPVALLAAALVIGVALGFGSAFVGEMRHPRVSDEHEVERVTGARVIARVRPRVRDPMRSRRAADRNAPPYFDPSADAYQLTYLHVARTGASRLMLTIASADTGIAAVIAMNVAAIAADEARSTIIIDTDSRTSPVAAALRSHAEPGLADVMQRSIDSAEVTTQAAAGRDRMVDVIPSGIAPNGLNVKAVTELFRREAARLARHYEAIVIVASVEQAVAGLPGALPIPDTIICAQVNKTRLSDLSAAIHHIRAGGGNPVGLVLWDASPPALPSPERIAASPRPLRTQEMQAITSNR
jgi:Mrp family chromosome partitioning ATPase